MQDIASTVVGYVPIIQGKPLPNLLQLTKYAMSFLIFILEVLSDFAMCLRALTPVVVEIAACRRVL